MMQKIQIFSSGCRLNALEAEKIRRMLEIGGMRDAIIFNTCAVTNEAIRQSRQQFRKIQRKNPNINIFVTGCGATMKPDEFPGGTVIANKDKMNPSAYGLKAYNASHNTTHVTKFEKMEKKGFVQIGDGCDRVCSYCITRILRGPAIHYLYDDILAAAKALVANGYEEIILTGVNIADYNTGLTDLCRKLLADLPKMNTLTLSSMDPAYNDLFGIMDLIAANPRMKRHLHLSAQSCSDEILRRMGRRHNLALVRKIMSYGTNLGITFSWDIICGFPGETDELFAETLGAAMELRPVKIHAFPFSARPGTEAAMFPIQIPRAISKARVKNLELIIQA